MNNRIGIVTQWFDPEGGAAATPGIIARSLARRGHSVDVLTGFPNYPAGKLHKGYRLRHYQQEQMGGITVHRTPLYPSHDSRAMHRAANYMTFAASASLAAPFVLSPVDVALVHSSPATTALPAMALRTLRHTPFVVHIQDLWPQTVVSSGFLEEGRVGRVERTLQAFCDTVYRRAHTIAVTSPGMADAITRRGVPDSKLAFVPNWADESAFRPVDRDQQLAAQLGITRPFTVMYAGNFGTFQALDSAIEAATRLRDNRDIGFVFVGSGVEERALKSMARERDLTNVRFVEAQPMGNMAHILALGDVQLVSLQDLPLFHRTMPSKIQATLSAGRPVIAAVSGDAARILDASGAGRVVPPQDPRAMADAILELRLMPRAELSAMGAAGREYYRSTLSEDVAAARLSDLLLDAGAARRRR
nr:glycosyltransferase family 4 protein [Georgenia faecalis]